MLSLLIINIFTSGEFVVVYILKVIFVVFVLLCNKVEKFRK